MSDTRAVSANRDARERMIPNRLVNNSRETLDTKEEKTLDPRYLVCLESFIGPKMEKIVSLVFWVVFGLKKIEDFSVFIFCPEAFSYI